MIHKLLKTYESNNEIQNTDHPLHTAIAKLLLTNRQRYESNYPTCNAGRKFFTYRDSSMVIMDNLPDSVFVGGSPTQSTDVRTNLVFPEGVQNAIHKFINIYYTPSFSKTGPAIQWAINALSIGTDSSSEGIISHTRLNADMFHTIFS